MSDQFSAGVVVVGAGQASGELAQRLRAGGYRGRITLVGDEPEAPYQRPPLSKKFLAGEITAEHLQLRSLETLAREDIDLKLGRRATGIDRDRQRLLLDDGSSIGYATLVIATGAAPRLIQIEGATAEEMHVIRTIADIERLRPVFKPGASAVVAGAGFIGLEVAAIGRSLGLEVAVIEMADRPLCRVTSPETGQFFLDEHVKHGVQFAFKTRMASWQRVDGRGLARLENGTALVADFIIAGVGARPRVELAEQAGIEVNDGILVDQYCRTSDPNIFAVGDCARRPLRRYGTAPRRLESVHNAIEGAKIAAAAILGVDPPALEAPWFWSDQYDLKLQMAGLSDGYDRMVVRGTHSARSFAHFYCRGDELLAVDAVNRPADYLGAKRMLEAGTSPPLEMLADEKIPMRQIMAAAK